MRKVHTVADLEFELPDCTVCPDGGDMNCDARSVWCEKCGTSWNSNGSSGYTECEECEEDIRTYTLVGSKRMCLGCAVDAPVPPVPAGAEAVAK